MSRLETMISRMRSRTKETTARAGKTTGRLIDDDTEVRDAEPLAEAKETVRRARRHAGLTEDEAISVALDEVRRVRAQR